MSVASSEAHLNAFQNARLGPAASSFLVLASSEEIRRPFRCPGHHLTNSRELEPLENSQPGRHVRTTRTRMRKGMTSLTTPHATLEQNLPTKLSAWNQCLPENYCGTEQRTPLTHHKEHNTTDHQPAEVSFSAVSDPQEFVTSPHPEPKGVAAANPCG